MGRKIGDAGLTSVKKGNGLGVSVRNNNVEVALKVLKKKVKDNKLLIEYKKKMEYEKPSAKRRRDRRAKIKRSKKYQNSYK